MMRMRAHGVVAPEVVWRSLPVAARLYAIDIAQRALEGSERPSDMTGHEWDAKRAACRALIGLVEELGHG